MEKLKILCTGNPDDFTIARSVKEIFPDADFISRRLGYDLNMDDSKNVDLFREKIKNYNVLINSSWIDGNQQRLLEIAHQAWSNSQEVRYILSIGSNAEFDGDNYVHPSYARSKLNLRNCSLKLNSPKCRTTHIILSGINYGNSDHNRNGIDPINIAKAMKWILDNELSIPLISLESNK